MNAQPLSGDQRLPIYQRLADILRRDVTEGRLRPGDRVPSDNELSHAYELSPGTVRKALDLLVQEDLFERFHGRGTFVRRPSFDASLFRFFRFRTPDGTKSVPEGRILRRTREKVPSYIARQLKIPEGDAAISMSRLRLIDDVPIVAEEIWLPLQRFEAFLDILTEDVGNLLYPVYDEVCGQLIAKAEESLTAEAASAETARLLRIETGSPVMMIDRLAKGYDGTPMEWRRSRGRADLFHYHTEIR
ncbi:MAG: GntR family transcriptional regulator [Cohaesibacter sp.]|nr:GntR family transcriptional regulator [Cohaesibacter sp.]MCV6600954.1 GntR family transcriptional regulator [Cohaesibacter sp.]